MGNTNLPQAGAADTTNSRDTLSGDDQLTDQQKTEAGQGVGPSPSRPKDAPERVPGQRREPETTDDEKRDPGDDRAAFGGHANTGHSASKAT